MGMHGWSTMLNMSFNTLDPFPEIIEFNYIYIYSLISLRIHSHYFDVFFFLGQMSHYFKIIIVRGQYFDLKKRKKLILSHLFVFNLAKNLSSTCKEPTTHLPRLKNKVHKLLKPVMEPWKKKVPSVYIKISKSLIYN